MDGQNGGDLATNSRPPAPTVFGNENQQSDKVKAEIQKQEQEARELLPVATTVSEFIAEERKDIERYHSYMASIMSRNGAKQPKGDEIAAEFRAREIFLAMLERFEKKIEGRISALNSKVRTKSKDDGATE